MSIISLNFEVLGSVTGVQRQSLALASNCWWFIFFYWCCTVKTGTRTWYPSFGKWPYETSAHHYV